MVPESYANLSVLSQIQAEVYIGILPTGAGGTSLQFPYLPFQPVRYLSQVDNESLEVLHAIRDLIPYNQELTLSNDQLCRDQKFTKNYMLRIILKP